MLATANFGSVILGLASLSFLGLGMQPPTPEWGVMINEARAYFQTPILADDRAGPLHRPDGARGQSDRRRPTRRIRSSHDTPHMTGENPPLAELQAISTIPIGDAAPRVVNTVIEIPRGSATKYEYDEAFDVLRVDVENRSVLPFPADYGFIPRARSEDGDLLDIFVLGSGQTAPGTVVRARPIGLLDMTDNAGRDGKIIGIAHANVPLRIVMDIGDLKDRIREEIEEFLYILSSRTVSAWP